MARESLQKGAVRVPDFLELTNNGDQPEGRMTRMPGRQDVDERIADIREQLIIEIATRATNCVDRRPPRPSTSS